MRTAASIPTTVRQSLTALLDDTVTDPASAFGYRIATVFFGETCEVTLEKQGASFVLWLRPANDAGPCYQSTARFKIGYNGNPPDKLGYALLAAACAQIEAWETTLPEAAQMQLFDHTPSPQAPAAAQSAVSMDRATEALLSETTFSSIYCDWLAVRERDLAARLQQLKPAHERNVLLVNATMGLQFYASMVDFFLRLRQTHDRIRATSVSYFDGIFEFQRGVADKGLPVVSVADVMSWDVAEINRFDVIILIGPSDIMAKLMTLEGLTAKLILLDLGFYHQVLEAHPTFIKGAEVIDNKAEQINQVVGYSCQPEAKVLNDFAQVCSLQLVQWRWVNYIPIGFNYCTYYRSDRRAFDVALLGSSARDYAQIDPRLFAGMRFLFLGNAAAAPEIERLRRHLDITVISRVSEDTYARLLALCRCFLLPVWFADSANVLLSVCDTIATGTPLVTSPHLGLERLERERVPAVFYSNKNAADLADHVKHVVHNEKRLQEIESRSIAFAKERLDFYRTLEEIVEEQVL